MTHFYLRTKCDICRKDFHYWEISTCDICHTNSICDGCSHHLDDKDYDPDIRGDYVCNICYNNYLENKNDNNSK